MKLAPTLLLLALSMASINGVLAQTQARSATVYRCGAEGRDLRDSPCPAAAKAIASQVEFDQPSSAQSRSARELAIADAKRARAMEQERLKQEAAARRQAVHATGINGLSAPPPAKPASAPKTTPAKPPKLHKPAKPPKPVPASG